MICGNFSEYLGAALIKPPGIDIHNWLNCPQNQWVIKREQMSFARACRHSVYFCIFVVITGGLCYFHLLFEQMVGYVVFYQWSILLLITIICDLIVFGLSPGKSYCKDYVLINNL